MAKGVARLQQAAARSEAGTRPLASGRCPFHVTPTPLLVKALADLLRTVDRPESFHAAGAAELLPPSVVVEGVGPVALPLLPVQAEQLIGAAEPAPFVRGQDTIVDPVVRRCWQVGPGQVRIGGRHWARTLDGIVARAADGLGVTGPVTAEFHKLLLYGEGGFFVGHRDTEKAPGMLYQPAEILTCAQTLASCKTAWSDGSELPAVGISFAPK